MKQNMDNTRSVDFLLFFAPLGMRDSIIMLYFKISHCPLLPIRHCFSFLSSFGHIQRAFFLWKWILSGFRSTSRSIVHCLLKHSSAINWKIQKTDVYSCKSFPFCIVSKHVWISQFWIVHQYGVFLAFYMTTALSTGRTENRGKLRSLFRGVKAFVLLLALCLLFCTDKPVNLFQPMLCLCI